jgi:hypothetical protein
MLTVLKKYGKGGYSMGTTGGGGSGSGSGVRVGGGGGSSGSSGGAGSYVSSNRKISSKSYNSADIKSEIGRLFKQLFNRALPYMKSMFYNPYLDQVYEELFSFSRLMRDQNSLKLISDRYNLDMEETGFILNLINRLDEKYWNSEVDTRCANAVRQTLEDFLFKAVKDDHYLVVDGTGREVAKVMNDNADFWKSLSGHFLSTLASAMYEKEIERKGTEATFAFKKEIERRTNHVISSYKQLNRKGKPNYQDIFKYIGRNWEWFKTEMTR